LDSKELPKADVHVLVNIRFLLRVVAITRAR